MGTCGTHAWQNYRHSSVDIKYSGSVSTFATLSLKNKSQEIKYLTALLNNVPNQSPCPQWAVSRPLLGTLRVILVLHFYIPVLVLALFLQCLRMSLSLRNIVFTFIFMNSRLKPVF